MTPTPQAAIRAASATEEELLLQLGVLLSPDATRDGDPTDLRGRAQDWLDRERGALRELLCGSPLVQSLQDNATDIAALADIIATATGKPPLYTVAAIILKRGLGWLCRSDLPS